MRRQGMSWLGTAIVVLALGFSSVEAEALTPRSVTQSKGRIGVGKGALKRYRTTVQKMIHQALTKQAAHDPQLRHSLAGTAPAAIRFSTKPASTARYRKGRALKGSSLQLRDLAYSFTSPQGAKVAGKGDVIVDRQGNVQQEALGAKWYQDFSYRLR